jgi:hypothetical protein
MRPRWHTRGRRHAGQALVEAALAALPVLLLGIGLIQFALYLYAWHVLDAAVLEGARVASAQGRTVDEGVAYARELVRGGLGPAGYLETPTIDGSASADQVVLEGHSALHLVIPLATDTRLPLEAHATVRKEHFRPGGRTP